MKLLAFLLDYLTGVFTFVWLLNEPARVFGYWLTLLFIMVLCIVNIIAIATENPKTPKPY